jgi:acetoacetyl-CoA synthetase
VAHRRNGKTKQLVTPELAATPIWVPDPADVGRTQLAAYTRALLDRGVECAGYRELWRWSVDELEEFWRSLWEYFEIAPGPAPERVLEGAEMPDVSWFPGTEVNFAEHMLKGERDTVAVVSVDEPGAVRRLTYGELRLAVGAAQAGLRELGVGRGDRVVALLPNALEALVAVLATTGLGAIWSSCAPEFGTQAVLDRFGQLEPAVLLAVESYVYGGRTFDRSAELEEVRRGLPTLRDALVVGRNWDVLDRAPQEPSFERVPFEHPLWVLYSSGTTGLPKGIVHGHGGVLLETLKSTRLTLDLGPSDRFLWYTTTGWMMWNVVVGALCSGGTSVLYDGSAIHPSPLTLWQVAADAEVTSFGMSAAFVQACMKAGIDPAAEVDLSRLRAVGSTGSPLSPEGFRWLAEEAVPGRPVFSTSGGTDVCTSFLVGNFTLPVYAGELSCRALGVAAEAWDPDGRPLLDEVGELVVTKPMPSMPIALWNDDDRSRLRETYYSFYPGVWRHGDWVTFTERGTAILHGRSDATLNRGGIRMGTSEFYRVVESLPEVADSLVVEDGPNPTTARLLLFVVLAPGAALDDDLRARIAGEIRTRISPRHVPDEVIQVAEVPRTLNGKKLEVPVKQLLSGVPLERAASTGSLANPDALKAFVGLQTPPRP